MLGTIILLSIFLSVSKGREDNSNINFEVATFLEPFSANGQSIVDYRRERFPGYEPRKYTEEVRHANSAKKRMCAVTNEFAAFDNNGGIGTFFHELVNAALGQSWNWNVTVLYTSSPDPVKLAEFRRLNKNVKVNILDCNEIDVTGFRRILSRYRTQQKAYCVARWLYQQETSFDVVHFHENAGIGSHAVQLKTLKLAFHGTEFVTTAHGDSHWAQLLSFRFYGDIHHLHLTAFERNQLANSDIVVSPSAYMIDHAEKLGWTLPKSNRIFVIPNLIAAPADSNITSGSQVWKQHKETKCFDGELEFVFVGRLEPRKGLMIMVEAIELLADSIMARKQDLSNVTVSFMGRTVIDPVLGNTSSWIQKQYEQGRWGGCKVRGRLWFRLLTNFGREEVFEYFANSSGRIAVVPSLNENSPYTVAECLHNGVPLLASGVGGIPDLVAKEDRHKILFHPPTAEALAIKLHNVLIQEVDDIKLPHTLTSFNASSKNCSRGILPIARPVMTSREIANTWLGLHKQIVFKNQSYSTSQYQSLQQMSTSDTIQSVESITAILWAVTETILDSALFVKRVYSLLLAFSAQSYFKQATTSEKRKILPNLRVFILMSTWQRKSFNIDSQDGFETFERSLKSMYDAVIIIIDEICQNSEIRHLDENPNLKNQTECIRLLIKEKTAPLWPRKSFIMLMPLDEMLMTHAVRDFVLAAKARQSRFGKSGVISSAVVGLVNCSSPPQFEYHDLGRRRSEKLLGTHYEEAQAWTLVQKTGQLSLLHDKDAIFNRQLPAQQEQHYIDKSNDQKTHMASDAHARIGLRNHLRKRLRSHSDDHSDKQILHDEHRRLQSDIDNEAAGQFSNDTDTKIFNANNLDTIHNHKLYMPSNVKGSQILEPSSAMVFVATALSSFQEAPLPDPEIERSVLADMLAGGSKTIFMDVETFGILPSKSLEYFASFMKDKDPYTKGFMKSVQTQLVSRLVFSLEGNTNGGLETIPVPLVVPLSSLKLQFGSDIQQMIHQLAKARVDTRMAEPMDSLPVLPHQYSFIQPAAEVLRDVFNALTYNPKLSLLVEMLAMQLPMIGPQLLHPDQTEKKLESSFQSKNTVIADSKESSAMTSNLFQPGFMIVAPGDDELVAEGPHTSNYCENGAGGIWMSRFDEDVDATGHNVCRGYSVAHADFSDRNEYHHEQPMKETDHFDASKNSINKNIIFPSKKFKGAFIAPLIGELQPSMTASAPMLELQPIIEYFYPPFIHSFYTTTVVIDTRFLQSCGNGVNISLTLLRQYSTVPPSSSRELDTNSTSTDKDNAIKNSVSAKGETRRNDRIVEEVWDSQAIFHQMLKKIPTERGWQSTEIPIPRNKNIVALRTIFSCGGDCQCDRLNYRIQILTEQI